MDIFKNGKIASSTNNSGTTSSQPTQVQTHKISPESRRFTQCGILPAQTSLDGFDRYHESQNSFFEESWKFPPHVPHALVALFLKYKESRNLVNQLKDEEFFDGRVSNDLNDIKSKTSANFQMDEKSIQRITDAGNALFCWSKFTIVLPDWTPLKSYFEGSSSTIKLTLPKSQPKKEDTSMFSSLVDCIMGTSFDANRPVIFCQDQWGYKVGAYTVPFGNGHQLEISFTNLNSFIPTTDASEPPSIEEIVLSHTTRQGWQDLTEINGQTIKGFECLSVRIPITNPALSQLLGTKKGNGEIAGVQTQGYLQINEETPVNFKMESVVVYATRGGSSSINGDEYYKFYQKRERGWGHECYNLVEVKIDGYPVFYTTQTEEHLDR